MKKKIIVIGKSLKFIQIIKKIYPNSIVELIPWRSITRIKKENLLKKPDIILVCGYDYKSQWYSLKKFCKVNIKDPYNLIHYLYKKNTKIIYVNTITKLQKTNKIKNFTLSRYEFAKKKLCFIINKKFNNVQVIELPPILNNKKEIDIFGGKFTKYVFNFLLYWKIIKFISSYQLITIFRHESKYSQKYVPIMPKPILLKFPRPLLIDRVLRIISD